MRTSFRSNKLVSPSHELFAAQSQSRSQGSGQSLSQIQDTGLPVAVGIVSEFNPFHKGHRYLIDTAKTQLNADVVVSVMSGNFTQRGEPAVFDKWKRAQLAVENGVDLVLQIPTLCACASADYFAKGAISVLEGLGAIDFLAFGSESGDIEALKRASFLLDFHKEELDLGIKRFLKEGMTYPEARERVITSLLEEDLGDILREPNNILALEYLRNLRRMEPFTVKRAFGGHHSSASEIRREMERLDGARLSAMESRYFQLVCYKVLATPASELERLGSAGEGLGNKLLKEVRYGKSRLELVDLVKSRAFTYTRVNRLLAQCVLGICKEDFAHFSPYVRVLGSSEKGRRYLKAVKKRDLLSIPVVDNVNKAMKAHPEISRTLAFDIMESDVYNLISGADCYENSEFVRRGFLGE